jgi:hypothetical protein
MFYQIVLVINSYEIVTHFEVVEMKFMPNIEFEYFGTNSKSSINNLLEIYPEMEQYIRSEQNSRKIFTKFFLKVISDKKLNEFQKITDSLKIIESCHTLIVNDLINCLEGDFGIK